MKKIDLGVIVTTLIIVTISCSLAFFAARVVGNPKDINLVAKNVSITFTDTSSIADETISPGWNNVKTFTITNNSKEDFNYNIILKGLVNTFESINTLQYKITSDTGYNMDNYLNVIKTETSKDVVLAYDVVIPKGSKQTYQVEFKYVSIEEDQSSDMGKKLSGTLAIEESTGKPKICDKLLSDNPTIKTRTDFSTIFTESNVNTLYKSKENNTDVYYFAGDARNNWVKFGEWQEDKTTILGDFKKVDSGDVITLSQKEFSTMAECSSYKITALGVNYEMANCRSVQIAKKGDPMYWRIIRSNQDGSIRLLYAGTNPDTEKGYIGTSVFSEFEGIDPLNIGYMYGTSGSLVNNRTNENSSVIKNYIDNWYNKHLLKLNSYISQESVYCQDRSISVNSSYDNYKTPGNHTNFSASDRIKKIGNNSNPTYSCESKEDGFSVLNTNYGNGNLKYSISLMTVDEAVYAGGLFYEKNEIVWYSNNNLKKSITGDLWSWLLTPGSVSTYNKGNIYALGGDQSHGRIGEPNVILSNVLAVRPVISIKGDSIYKTGDGSAENPYIIEAVPVNTYEVNLNVNSGSGTGTVLVEEGKDATFTVTPSDGYKAELETDTCGGTLIGNTYTISNVTSGKTCSITFKSDNPFSSGTLAAKIYTDNPTRVTRETFDTTFTSNTTGTLFTATEKNVHNTTDTPVYYYAGNTTNNWLKFAGYYWRIIRTNADGSIRMLYSGTSHDTTSGYLSTTTSAFNSTYNSPKYVGYMYGNYDSSLSNARTNTNNSTIKNAIDYWYSTNMTSYTKYLSTTAVYCNDRDLRSGDTYTTSTSSTFYYAPYAKVYSSYAPTYDCTEAIDAFSVDNTSAKLTYPIALMTADEIMYAGGKGNNAFTSSYAWYYLNSANGSITGSTYWWLMSPYRWISGYAHVFIVAASDNPGWFGSSYTGYDYGVRPVVSLKSCVKTSGGDGSASNPYTIEETTSGC